MKSSKSLVLLVIDDKVKQVHVKLVIRLAEFLAYKEWSVRFS